MVNSRISNELDEIILRQDSADNDQIKRLEWHYEILDKNRKQAEPSKLNRIVPRRDADQNPFRLHVSPSRFLADLVWATDSSASKKRLLPGQLEIRVHCVGLNFRDVLKVRGLYPHTRPFGQLERELSAVDRDTEPGVDFMGTVVRSLSNLLQPNDRVFGSCLRGAFHSHLIVNEFEVARVPAKCSLSDEQLAALPTPFLTAIYSLNDRVQLKSGQTVLVHAATGATGQAIIQYCHSVGAKVIATAGTDEKRLFLREHYGLEHVFNSRDLSFVNFVRELMPDGVDVVVNSLVGSLMHESVKLLAVHGHFVELGKRDVFAKSQLAMFDLRTDCTFHIIDLVLLNINRTDHLSIRLETILAHIDKGIFTPIQPITIFEPSQVVEAFTQCNRGSVMGKSLIRLTNSDQALHLETPLSTTAVDEGSIMFLPDVFDSGTILISGGFGGLGLTMSRWMVEKRGVKRILLMSRRMLIELEQPNDNPHLDDWLRLKQIAAIHGAHIEVVQVDVTKFIDVHRIIERLNQTIHPVRGIIHSAGIFQNETLPKLKQDIITRIMEPKIRGAWNLHHACELLRVPLHFFIFFSSIRNHFIDFAACAYNAGNEFLDALAHYRSDTLGLPALSVSLPAVSGAGMFHLQKDLLTHLQHTDVFESVPTVATFELIEQLFVEQRRCSCPIIFAVKWEMLASNKSDLPTFQLVKIVEQQQVERMMFDSQLLVDRDIGNDRLTAAVDAVDMIVERTRKTVARLLGSTSVDRIDVDRSLLAQGMDSLAAVSLFNWLGQEWGTFIQLAELLQGISIQVIANQMHRKLTERQTAARVETTTMVTRLAMPVEIERTDSAMHDMRTSYTGMNQVVRILPGSSSDILPLFCITATNTIDTKFQFDGITSSIIYVLQVPSASDVSTCAHQTIAQMRRIHPRGPYSLVAIDNDEGGALVAREIVKQLEQYAQAGVINFSLIASSQHI